MSLKKQLKANRQHINAAADILEEVVFALRNGKPAPGGVDVLRTLLRGADLQLQQVGNRRDFTL